MVYLSEHLSPVPPEDEQREIENFKEFPYIHKLPLGLLILIISDK